MEFDEILTQVTELLQRQGRISYGALKRRFHLDDEYLQDLKDELIDAQRIAVDEGGKVLVWTGKDTEGEKAKRGKGEKDVVSSQLSVVSPQPPAPSTQSLAERRQLTVMFCDLVGSTALSTQLDPEELREVVQAYQETCTEVVQRYAGYVAQHLGDGILVYFGYPLAHEDEASRAVRAGLEIVEALRGQVTGNWGHTKRESLQVRIGIHTGLVVIGEIGSSEKREILAMGETPNIAARIQGTANPDEVVISAATYRLIEGLFICEDRGQPELKGVATSLTLYRVSKESDAHSRFEVVVRKGLTPLVGREHEFGLVHERWQRVQDGAGQVVLLSGEPGIGKSRLVEALKETVEHEGARCLELRCSPYAQNSALYPVIEHLQRTLQFRLDDTPAEKLQKLEQAVGRQGRLDKPAADVAERVMASAAKPSLQGTEIASSPLAPRTDTSRLQDEVPLLTALLSLPPADRSPALRLSPQKQKEKTHEALVAWLCAEAKQRAVVYAWEDLHWADPSTLELLTLFLQQVPTTRLLAVLTFRPEFTPPWGAHSYLSQLTLSRLGRSHVEVMVEKVTGGNALPAEMIKQIVIKTDGVPLFVEELTKSVMEQNVGAYCNTPLLGIPATLQDALMARLDRLGTAKEIAQLGAMLGREFTYELLHAVSPLNEDMLQQGLRQLVETELVFQSGVPPQARYLFKHALVQDTAYQSLLKSRRQQLHEQVARVLEEQFPQTIEMQPELVAHHYTEAGLASQAIPYWQRAGQRASQRSAYVEAISHLTTGLDVLKALPDASERAQEELVLQTTLGHALTAIRGWSDPGVGTAYARSLKLCQQLGDSSQLSRVLFGLWAFYVEVPQFQTAQEMGKQLLSLAQKTHDQSLLVDAHFTLGFTLFFGGEIALARDHLQQGIALRASPQERSRAALYGFDPGVPCQSVMAYVLWLLGYPDQALKSSGEARALAQDLSHPYSSAIALYFAAAAYQCRREGLRTQEQAEALIRLCTEQGFTLFLAWGTILQGSVLAEQGEQERGIALIQQGLTASRATGGGLRQPYWLALLAEAYGTVGQIEEGLSVLAEAFTIVDKTEERWCEAELYRLKGELTLQKSSVVSRQLSVTDSRPLTPDPQGKAEACFLRAIDIARKQQAKSLELRAATSLARLWQQQGKQTEAHKLLSEVYNWFTEGFDTKDLQEARTLLKELSR